MSAFKGGRFKIGLVEMCFEVVDGPGERTGVGSMELCDSLEQLEDGADGLRTTYLSFEDLKLISDQTGLSEGAVATTFTAHEFGHVILLRLGMTQEEQLGTQRSLAEWLAWRFAYPALKKMSLRITFAADPEFRWPDVSDDTYVCVRAACLRTYGIKPNDKDLEAAANAWLTPERMQHLLRLIG